ncbi:2EXR domain-containing protein [Madurella fahalii]|uniref:2EXR domain-containing protein n=1 Tax=Madurella fahalii TaxID=1157608 RepID=A0ABQ0GE98_9PEZI
MSQGSSMSFPLFSNLPAELRLMIWERVPQPTRLIGQMPCSVCSGIFKDALTQNAERRLCADTRHPDWRLRYIVQSPNHAIFPPLHACRESRSVWLPRYFRPPRYISLRDSGYEPDEDSRLPSYNLRFDVPFISYEADVFTIFHAWAQADVDIGTPLRATIDRFDPVFGPFLGLDRSRIQQIGIGEGAERLVDAVIKLDLNSLPSLRKLFVLCFGPDPRPSHARLRLQMSVSEVQHLDCDLCHIPDHVIATHRLFNHGRLRHPHFSPRPHLTPLRCFLEILKGWLWHAKHTTLQAVQQEDSSAVFDFEDCVLEGDTERGGSGTCPLRHVPGCGPAGHTHNDMVSWVPPFTINCMILYDKSWLRGLDWLPSLDLEALEEKRKGLD